MYRKAVKSSASVQSEISSATIEIQAIRTVAEEDSRSRNVVIFGLRKKQSEDLTAAVGQVFSELSEKPKLPPPPSFGHLESGPRRTMQPDQ